MRRTRRASAVLGGFQHPAQMIVTAFGIAVLLGTATLALPFATESGESAGWLTALFTATSSVCVTGLAVVDVSAHWSAFGTVVIGLLIQIGGLGIMTLASLFTVLVSGRLGLRARLFAQEERKAFGMADVRRLLRRVVLFSIASEAIVATVLTLRLATAYGEPPGRAAYLGVFHAVSAFNNAGVSLWPDSLTRFVTDPWICLTIAAAVIVGGLGYPVVFELLRCWRHPSRWTVLTRITLAVTAALLPLGTLIFLGTEWSNPHTLGALDESDRMLAGFFTAVMPRSAGFNSLDIGQMHPSSWLTMDLLMFIGGGSAGTAGGIKVTTFGLLAFIIWSELRGEVHVNIGHRRLPEPVQRQAVTIAVISATVIVIATYILLVLTPHNLDRVMFEVVSAFTTCGLSTGITSDIAPAGHALLVLLMFVGRIGPLTFGSALALKERARRYELPEERIIVG